VYVNLFASRRTRNRGRRRAATRQIRWTTAFFHDLIGRPRVVNDDLVHHCA
jgi:hypothetical protein